MEKMPEFGKYFTMFLRPSVSSYYGENGTVEERKCNLRNKMKRKYERIWKMRRLVFEASSHGPMLQIWTIRLYAHDRKREPPISLRMGRQSRKKRQVDILWGGVEMDPAWEPSGH